MSATKLGQPHLPEQIRARASSHTDCDPNHTTRSTHDQISGNFSSDLLPPLKYNASLYALDTAPPQAHSTIASPHSQTPLSASLRLQTDLLAEKTHEQPSKPDPKLIYSHAEPEVPSTTSAIPTRNPSVRSTLAAARPRTDSPSPASALSSPGVGPLMDLTPLPSPITAAGSPASWRRSMDSGYREEKNTEVDTVPIPTGSHLEPTVFMRTSPKKRRTPIGILSTAQGLNGSELSQIEQANALSHARNRSLSEYVPDSTQIPRTRNIVVSGSGGPPSWQPLSPPDSHMHREAYLAVQRGLTLPAQKPPTPPTSNRGADSSDPESPILGPDAPIGPLPLRYEARTIQGNKLQKWKAVRQLGKGTFSTVMLAIRENVGSRALVSHSDDPLGESINEDQVDPHTLVAVKICEQGPAGGADEAKIETSLKREVEILKSIHYPSLVHLKAFSIVDRRAFLVLNYCAGGDLFDLASLNLEILVPGLIRRIFAELVAAVHYLHLQYIVHRDIKLESTSHNYFTCCHYKAANCVNQTSWSISRHRNYLMWAIGRCTQPLSLL